ncbi:MAG TPA: GNAT family N-acetyltransferase [Allosphingosinicella sp.]|nr:GNAT family N-acetyltransferase [Allosphingosinicella sp.]
MANGSPQTALEIVRLSPATRDGLLALLQALEASGEAELFRPHPFTAEHLDAIGDPQSLDLYYVATAGGVVAGYGLLRGWEEGYTVPSLGIAVHPAWRGRGLAATLMHFLHGAARLRRSERVRLRVLDTNERAIRLYRRSGYVFQEKTEVDARGNRMLVGFKELGA